MSTNANKFLFDRDVRYPGGGVKSLAALQEAEQRGFARGLAEGRRQAASEAEAQLAAAMRRLAETAGSLLSALPARHA